MVVLIFKGLSILFSIVAAPIYIPTNSVQGFPSLYILANTYYLVFLMTAILTGVRWYLIVILIALPWWLIISDIFSCICWPLVYLLWEKKLSIQFLCPFSNRIFSIGLLIYFGYQLLIRYMVCKHFLPFSRLPLHFVDCFLYCADVFVVWHSPTC